MFYGAGFRTLVSVLLASVGALEGCDKESGQQIVVGLGVLEARCRVVDESESQQRREQF